VNELRYDNAMLVANELIDFYKIDELSRSPAVFCSNKEYEMTCGFKRLWASEHTVGLRRAHAHLWERTGWVR
jgi:hypothetical protein